MTLPLAESQTVSVLVRGGSEARMWRSGRLYGLAAAASLLVHVAIVSLLLPVLRERDEPMMTAGGPVAIQVDIAANSPTESVASSAAPADEAPRADEPAPTEKSMADAEAPAEPPIASAIENTEPLQETTPAPIANETVAVVPAPAESPQVAPDALAIQRAAQRQARIDEERRIRRIEQKRQDRLAQLEEERRETQRREKQRLEKKAQRERAEKARTEADHAARRTGTGHETVNSAAATRGGTAGAAAGAAQMANWRGQVLAHLAGFKQYPSAARERNVIGRPVVAFSLSPSGAVVSLSLVSSSGASILDDAALSMVRRAAPFPPMPAGGARASFTTAINYNMR